MIATILMVLAIIFLMMMIAGFTYFFFEFRRGYLEEKKRIKEERDRFFNRFKKGSV